MDQQLSPSGGGAELVGRATLDFPAITLHDVVYRETARVTILLNLMLMAGEQFNKVFEPISQKSKKFNKIKNITNYLKLNTYRI